MRKTIFYNVSLLLLLLFLSIVPQTNSRKTIFYNIFPFILHFYHFSSHQFFSVSKYEENNRYLSLLLPFFFAFLFFSPFPFPKKRFLKTRFTNSMKGEINPRAIDGRGSRLIAERDNDRASRKIGLKSRRRSFFLQASAAPVYKGAAIPVALHAIKS